MRVPAFFLVASLIGLAMGAPAGADPLRDGAWVKVTTPAAPMNRYGHWAVYDPARQQMIIGGGTYQNDIWAVDLVGADPWRQIQPSGFGPYSLKDHVAVLDPVRDRVLLIEGNSVRAFSLGANPAWTDVPAYNPPYGPRFTDRYDFSAVYDPIGDRLIVFGGRFVNEMFSEVWALPLSGAPIWQRITPQGGVPPVRTGHEAFFDATRNRMIVRGGRSPSFTRLDDLWTLELSGTPQWVDRSPSGAGPSLYSESRAIYDETRDRLWTYSSSYPEGERVTYVDLVDPVWKTLTLSGPRRTSGTSFTAVHDPSRDEIVLFGGNAGSNLRNDVWAIALDTGGAREVRPMMVPPRGWGAIADPVRHRLLVVSNAAVWALSLGASPAWSPVTTEPSSPNFVSTERPVVVYDSARDRLLAMGVVSGTGPMELWEFPLVEANPRWSKVSVPSPLILRQSFGMMYDPLRDRLLLFGIPRDGYPIEVWALSLAGGTSWQWLATSGRQPVQGWWEALYDSRHDRMLLVGGIAGSCSGSGGGHARGVWGLDLSGTLAWTLLRPDPGCTLAEQMFSAIYDPLRDRVVIYGGGLEAMDWAPAWAPGWRLLTPNSIVRPPMHYGQSAIYDAVGDQMVVYGGTATGEDGFQVWRLVWTDAVTSTLLRRFDGAWTASGAELRWKVAGCPAGATIELERSPHRDGPWTSLAVRSCADGGVGTILDPDADAATRSYYRLSVVDGEGSRETFAPVMLEAQAIDGVARITRVYPNPVSRTLRIEHRLSHASHVRIRVLDVAGREVARLVDGPLGPGLHEHAWEPLADATLRAGVYFIRWEAAGASETRRVVLTGTD